MIDALSSLWAKVALKQAIPNYEGDELHEAEELAALAGLFSPEDVQLNYQTCLLSKRDLVWAPDTRAHFEITLLRLLMFRPADADGAPAAGGNAAGGAAAGGRSAGAATTSGGGRTRGASSASLGRASAAAPRAESHAESHAESRRTESQAWAAQLAQLELSGAARQLAAHCICVAEEAGLIRLALDPAQSLLRTPALIEKLGQALSVNLGREIRVEIDLAVEEIETPARMEERAHAAALAATRRSLEEDPTVRAFKEKLGAQLKPDSVKLH